MCLCHHASISHKRWIRKSGVTLRLMPWLVLAG
jgi:hypothetical protein